MTERIQPHRRTVHDGKPARIGDLVIVVRRLPGKGRRYRVTATKADPKTAIDIPRGEPHTRSQ